MWLLSEKNIVYVVQYVYVYIIEDGMQYWYGIGMSNEDGDEGCMWSQHRKDKVAEFGSYI